MARVKLTKKSPGMKAAAKAAKGAAPLTEYVIQDNGDVTFTVLGVDAAGNQVDISGLATITVSSDNTSIVTVDPPVGMTSALHAVGPLGTCNLTAVATFNDGTSPALTFTLPVTTKTGPVSGVVIEFGTPTVH